MLLVALALAAPTAAQAAGCKPAPGRSGLEQYCESIPGADGPKGQGDTGKGEGGTAASIPKRSVARLAGKPAGDTLLNLAAGGRTEGPAGTRAEGDDVGPKTSESELVWGLVAAALLVGLVALVRFLRGRGGPVGPGEAASS